MAKTEHLRKKLTFQGVKVPEAPNKGSVSSQRIKNNSASNTSKDGYSLSHGAKKYLGSPTKSPSKSKPKTYNAAEVMLDVYRKLEPKQISGCSGFRSPGRTGAAFFRNASTPAAIEKLELTDTFATQDKIVASPAISPDNKHVIVCSTDHHVFSFQLNSKGQLSKKQAYDIGNNIIASPTFSPDGKHVVIRADDDFLHVFKISAHGRLKETCKVASSTGDYSFHASPIFSPDGKHLLVTSEPNQLASYRLDEKSQLVLESTVKTNGYMSSTPAFSPNGNTLVMGSMHSILAFGLNENGKLTPKGEIQTQNFISESPAFRLDGKYVVVPGHDKLLYFCGFDDHENLVLKYSLPIRYTHRNEEQTASCLSSPAFDANGAHMIIGSWNSVSYGLLHCFGFNAWDEPVLQSTLDGVQAWANPTFSPDGQVVYIPGQRSMCAVRVKEDGVLRKEAEIEISKDDLRSTPLVSLDGKYVFMGSVDHNFYVVKVVGEKTSL